MNLFSYYLPFTLIVFSLLSCGISNEPPEWKRIELKNQGKDRIYIEFSSKNPHSINNDEVVVAPIVSSTFVKRNPNDEKRRDIRKTVPLPSFESVRIKLIGENIISINYIYLTVELMVEDNGLKLLSYKTREDINLDVDLKTLNSKLVSLKNSSAHEATLDSRIIEPYHKALVGYILTHGKPTSFEEDKWFYVESESSYVPSLVALCDFLHKHQRRD